MNDFPLQWANSAEAATLWGRLRAEPRSLLMLDYDGTLAPFHNDRFQAAPYPGVAERLAALSKLPRTRVVLVSAARPVSFASYWVLATRLKSGAATAENN